MKNLIITLVLCTFTVAVSAAATAQWAVEFDAKKSNELLVNVETKKANTNKQAVSYSYKLEADEKLNFDLAPYVEKSKQYWIDSTGNKLLNGINLPVTGGQTVIRISPLTNDKSIQLDASMVNVLNNGCLLYTSPSPRD